MDSIVGGKSGGLPGIRGSGHRRGKIFLTLASGSPGGAYYPLGGGMSVVIQKTVEGFRCASESTGASVENSRLVGNGDSDMGMVMGSVGYNAAQGKDAL